MSDEIFWVICLGIFALMVVIVAALNRDTDRYDSCIRGVTSFANIEFCGKP